VPAKLSIRLASAWRIALMVCQLGVFTGRAMLFCATTRLLLKTILAMPVEKVRVRPLGRALGKKCMLRFIHEGAHAVRIVYLPRNQDLEVV
jgi:hypothetical protein